MTALLSPPSSTTYQHALSLPVARQTPLKPGSLKESSVIAHIDSKLLEISGKFERRFEDKFDTQAGPTTTANTGASYGYQTFSQLAIDVDRVVDVVWVSSTVSLQIPYIMHIAFSLVEYLQSFPLSPDSLFPLLHKIDLAFSSLMRGVNVESKQPLPDAGVRCMTTTEKVRLSTIIESTRVAVATVSQDFGDLDGDDGDDIGGNEDAIKPESTAYDTENEPADMDIYRAERHWFDVNMESARVYELTLGELGRSVDAGPLRPEQAQDLFEDTT